MVRGNSITEAGTAGYEPYSEVMASLIAQVLGLPDYNAWEIVKRTNACLMEAPYWLRFSEDRFASLSSCPVEPRIEAVFRDADASACPQDTELGGAVAQVVGGTLADGQHLRDLLYRVHQLCGLRAVGRRLDGIGSSDHLRYSRIRV